MVESKKSNLICGIISNEILFTKNSECSFIFFNFIIVARIVSKRCRSPPLIKLKNCLIGGKKMNENAKCFIKKDEGDYEEITYKELEIRRIQYKDTYKTKKFIPVQGMLLEVSILEYKEFYKDVERYKYCNKVSKANNLISLNELEGERFSIADMDTNVELQVERKLEVEQLKQALLKLDNNEYELIKALFYDERTVREYAKTLGIPFMTLQNRKKKILQKIKKYLKQ